MVMAKDEQVEGNGEVTGAFDGQDRETWYDTLIISCLNLMFDAPKG